MENKFCENNITLGNDNRKRNLNFKNQFMIKLIFNNKGGKKYKKSEKYLKKLKQEREYMRKVHERYV